MSIIISRNPQTNSVLERVHPIVGNIMRTFKVQDMVLDGNHPWNIILAINIFALCGIIYTTTQYTQGTISLYKNWQLAIN